VPVASLAEEAVGARTREDERGELVSGVGRADLEPVRRRLELRREFPERLQRRAPLTGFDAADVRIGDARLAEFEQALNAQALRLSGVQGTELADLERSELMILRGARPRGR
jgi:hypothetical protein